MYIELFSNFITLRKIPEYRYFSGQWRLFLNFFRMDKDIQILYQNYVLYKDTQQIRLSLDNLFKKILWLRLDTPKVTLFGCISIKIRDMGFF